MKRLFLALILGVSLVYGSGSITFSDAPSAAKRVAPSSGETILSYHDAIKDAKNSVVNIATTKTVQQNDQIQDMFNHPFFREFFGPGFQAPQQERKASSLGSGVIVSNDGYIITNNHVVEGADEIVVSLIDNSKEFKAKVIGLDPKSDLAVIKIDAKDLRAIKMGDSSALLEGDVVFAIGNPFGVGGTITQGIISALNKTGIGLNRYEDFIQTDASINPGNSGGALVDSRGALVGINTAILSRSGSNSGVGFAIPSNMAKTIAKALIETGKIERGYMGVSIGDLTSDLKEVYTHKEGALVLGVEAGGPADKANIKRLDLITQINSTPIKNANDLKNTVGALLPGETARITLERDNKVLTTNVALGNMDVAEKEAAGVKSSGIKGLSLGALDEESRYRFRVPRTIEGVLVLEVEENSDAQKFGFRQGDVIVQVEQTTVTSLEDFNKAMTETKRDRIRVLVSRGGYISPILVR
ncbi:MAG: Do family serine endopeptidase [Campylobacterales bacterium]|nr:Do family serine endopeptidase [Campylobacterales bacterium]